MLCRAEARPTARPTARLPALFLEEVLQLGARAVRRADIAFHVNVRPRLEVVAEIRALLVFDFLRDGLAAVLRNAGAVPLAQFADVQLRATRAALFEPP